MRKKAIEYLKKPSVKLFGQLTSMEQKWVKAQLAADDAAAKDKKPK